ncbi:MAG: redoxin domain-containing protein, partial [Candidatus Halalkalibacterium sp. M3_1C_030]
VQSGKESAVSFIDSVLSTGNTSSQLLAMKGNALLSLSNDKKGDEKEEYFQRGLKAAEKARDMNPDTFDAYYLPGFYLNANGDKQKALEMLEKAVTLSTSLSVHSTYWRAVRSNDNLEGEEKQEKIIADLEWLFENRPETPEMLQFVSQQYGELGMEDRKKELEQQVLENYPNSQAAEWVLVGRYRDYSREHGKTIAEGEAPEKKARYRSMLWDFINRPQHNSESLLGDAYRNLFFTFRDDSTVPGDTLLAVVDGMVQYEGINPHITHAGGAMELAERGIHFELAKEIAREGVNVAREKVNENREWAYKTDEEYQDAMDRYTGVMYDALGWVFFHEGKHDSAEKYLSHAYSLNDENKENLYHLGKLEEKKDNLAKAEHFYKEGMSVEGMGNNPNEDAIKMLYIQRNGSEEGYDSYLAGIMQKEKGNRKEDILSTRQEEAEPLSPFTMENLQGENFSSDRLQGKVAVINIWGKWCGPCVKEMPDIQKLHEKYRDSSEVMVLTINNDPDINEVRDWMKEREFNFPVLRDNGYLNKENMHLFPTTWFLNERSEVAFIQEGYTENLVEEFTWRIEDLTVE